jgi:hypothetical protein
MGAELLLSKRLHILNIRKPHFFDIVKEEITGTLSDELPAGR